MNTGYIERVDDNGVAWGTFENGRTFDLPSYGYLVGTEVLEIPRPPNSNTEEDGDVAYILSDARTATIIVCDYTDEGLEIINVQKLEKPTD